MVSLFDWVTPTLTLMCEGRVGVGVWPEQTGGEDDGFVQLAGSVV